MKNNTQPQGPQMVLLAPGAKFCQGPNPFVRKASVHDPSSRTIPDESFTISELHDRYRRGAPLPLGLERPISFGDDPTHNDLDLGRIQRMDLSEISDITKRLNDSIHFLNERKADIEAQKLELSKKGVPKGEAPLDPSKTPKPD